MLTAEQIDTFHADGYLLGPKVLTDAQVDELREELGRVIEDEGGSGPQPVQIANLAGEEAHPVWQIVNIWGASKAFRRLCFDPTIVAEIAQLTDPAELRLWHDQVQYKPAAVGGVNPWHQDNPYWPTLSCPDQVSAWVALDDVAEDNGCMSMVRGSHAWGNQIGFLHTFEHYDAMPDEWNGHRLERELRPVPKGHVHYHHALTWHGSHANTSGRPRRAIAVHYMTDKTCFVDSGKHLMEQFVTVGAGDKLAGDHFPLVWAGGQCVPAG
ncbi:MAG: phytanoyl-CoA dioxygenase family protein [Planctomycetaceae bacterium]|nr:phytanoyl-CoA dioxygenase family protein [Planctomycetaceae bacterium]